MLKGSACYVKLFIRYDYVTKGRDCIMRQMRKKIIIAVLVTLILTVTIAFIANRAIINNKDKVIETLEKQVVDTRCLAFARDLDAKSVIKRSDIKQVDVKETSLATGTYIAKGGDLAEHNIYMERTKNPEVTLDDLVGRVLKTGVSKNTLIMDCVLFDVDDDPTKDERIQEFNFIKIPSDLIANDYVDIRIQFPAGEDYSVLVGKKIEKIAGENTIFIKMNEEEIMTMGSAIIEAYMQEGVRLYANKYTEPSVQLINETTVDYLAKYKYAVDKIVNEKNDLNLRRELAKLLDNDGTLALTKDDTENRTEKIATETLNGATYVTKDMLDKVPEWALTEARRNSDSVSTYGLDAEELAKYAGIEKKYVEEIKLAEENNDIDVLDYYRNYKVKTRDAIKRTYAVKKEVLAVVKNNPNILDTIKAEFDERALLKTRVDEYEKLEREYNSATSEEARQQIKQKMDNLVKERTGNVARNLQQEIATQKAERIKYLESLING